MKITSFIEVIQIFEEKPLRFCEIHIDIPTVYYKNC